MNKLTLTALQKSIKHWQFNFTYPEDADAYPDANPLCLLFWYPRDGDCEGCPVAERTGKPRCRDTPWSEVEIRLRWYRIIEKCLPEGCRRGETVFDRAEASFKEAALDEINFLKSLLPWEKTKFKPTCGRKLFGWL